MVRLSLIYCVQDIQTSDKGNVQCSETEAECLINPPSRLIKIIEMSTSVSHTVIQSDIDLEDELFTEDVEIF